MKSYTFLLVALLLTFLTGCDMSKKNQSDPVALRVATFNVSMDASNYLSDDALAEQGAQALAQALDDNHPQIRAVAEIIQHTRPDVLVLNEFDYLPAEQGINRFQEEFLGVSQNGESPIHYPYVFLAPVNTGQPSPFDLNRDGKATGLADDAWGYGWYPGQYGMVVLSRYPIDQIASRTFRDFKWRDMPGALRPLLPESHEPWYSDAAWAEFPLSSKSHWDVVIDVKGKLLHVLVSHPTPPVFDGEENRNGRRNYDEIRFWADYITPGQGEYIYDDQGQPGGLDADSRFVIAGDLNASTEGNDNVPGAIDLLLKHPAVQAEPIPSSQGGLEHSPANDHGPFHTASWRKRADYVLPSEAGIHVIDAGVFWPASDQPKADLVNSRSSSSDHRLVWIDIQLR